VKDNLVMRILKLPRKKLPVEVDKPRHNPRQLHPNNNANTQLKKSRPSGRHFFVEFTYKNHSPDHADWNAEGLRDPFPFSNSFDAVPQTLRGDVPDQASVFAAADPRSDLNGPQAFVTLAFVTPPFSEL
jgi:hypothetical protein